MVLGAGLKNDLIFIASKFIQFRMRANYYCMGG
jgi:hypothetical protein